MEELADELRKLIRRRAFSAHEREHDDAAVERASDEAAAASETDGQAAGSPGQD